MLIVRVEDATILQDNYRNRFQKLNYRFCSISRNNCSEQELNKTVFKSDFCDFF